MSQCDKKILFTFLFILFPISFSHAEDQIKKNPSFDEYVTPYLKKHCIACHSEKKMEGDFRIDTLSKNVGIKDTANWAEIMERISSGEMPPEDVKDRPSSDLSASIVEWLSAKIKEGEAARMAKRESVSFHRLTREEYVNAVYDVLGVWFDASDPGGFTEDPEYHGFNRIGSILTLSPNHIEKYFKAAETILDEAYPEKPVEQVTLFKHAVDPKRVGEPYKSILEGKGLLEKVRFDCWPQDKFRYGGPGRLPAAGVYEVTVKLSGLKPADGRAPRLMIYHDKLDRVLFEQDVIAAEDKPVEIKFQTHLPEGHHGILMINDVPGPSNLPRSGRHGRKPFVSVKDGRIPWQLKLTDEEGNALYPFLIFDSVEWKGPIVTEEEKALRDSYMPAEEGNIDQVREGLSRMAVKAFRRPLYPGEIEEYVNIVQNELDQGSKFRDAVKTGMLAILCSKSFLFIVEGNTETNETFLNDFELATRLSFMFWGASPDQELTELAAQNKLHLPENLKAQTERMLADPRSKNFKTSFPSQWLQLHKVGMFTPDSKLYPEYDKHLENSMIGETQAFFAEVLDKNLPLSEFLDSSWAMVNPRMAAYYGIDGVTKDIYQRVNLNGEHHRGGILTHASILSLTSDGTRHRPVHRGVWVNEVILGKSPPPPPANVDAIEPNPVDSPKATLRDKLDAHKKNPNCASCHKKIDPYGLAFENYNAIGRWRTVEKVQKGTGGDPPVDASGELPNGNRFQNATEFKKLLVADMDDFNKTFIKKLAIYGIRRTVTIDDQDEIAAIAEQAKKNNYQVRSIVEAFVLSNLFRKR